MIQISNKKHYIMEFPLGQIKDALNSIRTKIKYKS